MINIKYYLSNLSALAIHNKKKDFIVKNWNTAPLVPIGYTRSAYNIHFGSYIHVGTSYIIK